VSNFYGTEIEIWAGFGQDGKLLKKNILVDYEQLLRSVYSCFQGQKKIKYFENIVLSALKSCINLS
jgi:hypothetical protein